MNFRTPSQILEYTISAIEKKKGAFSLELSGTKGNATLVNILRYTSMPKIGSFRCTDQRMWSVVPNTALKAINLLPDISFGRFNHTNILFLPSFIFFLGTTC